MNLFPWNKTVKIEFEKKYMSTMKNSVNTHTHIHTHDFLAMLGMCEKFREHSPHGHTLLGALSIECSNWRNGFSDSNTLGFI